MTMLSAMSAPVENDLEPLRRKRPPFFRAVSLGSSGLTELATNQFCFATCRR